MLKSAVIATALALSGGTALAADQAPAQNPTQGQAHDGPLATPQEHAEHRARMRAAKTAEEREKIRKEHHKFMKERARERGMNIPDGPTSGGGT
ncbi:hypothetical protein GALL_306900 [mine drainage metagenome]|uniref:Uncharacterized protein n=1 Tax=mine drainage metagenome TaxID=410659 RepID=A0A1J5R5X0_9ZZZZ